MPGKACAIYPRFYAAANNSLQPERTVAPRFVLLSVDLNNQGEYYMKTRQTVDD